MAPLGVYIHWPYCARICPYCDFNVVRDRGRVDEQAALVEAIADDLRAHAERTGPRRLVSIFLGGGTPSLMDPTAVGRLVALCRSLWTAAPDLEVTLEANPTDAESGRFHAFAKAGVNRLSLGVQALDDEGLRFLGRNHDAASAIRAVEIGAGAFPHLSLDLIYALPGQTAAAWTAALEQACGLGPEHISAYQLSIEPGSAFHRAVRRGAFRPAEPDLAADLYDITQAVLERWGYDAYEVSNHARGRAARARHNLVYWRGEDYVGVGPGAHGRLSGVACFDTRSSSAAQHDVRKSRIAGSFQQPNTSVMLSNPQSGRVEARTRPSTRLATEAEPRIPDYIRQVADTGVGWRVAEVLDPLARMEERVLMGLRIDEGVALAEAPDLDLARAEPLMAAGLLRIQGERLQVTASGRLVLDRLSAELLA